MTDEKLSKWHEDAYAVQSAVRFLRRLASVGIFSPEDRWALAELASELEAMSAELSKREETES